MRLEEDSSSKARKKKTKKKKKSSKKTNSGSEEPTNNENAKRRVQEPIAEVHRRRVPTTCAMAPPTIATNEALNASVTLSPGQRRPLPPDLARGTHLPSNPGAFHVSGTRRQAERDDSSSSSSSDDDVENLTSTLDLERGPSQLSSSSPRRQAGEDHLIFTATLVEDEEDTTTRRNDDYLDETPLENRNHAHAPSETEDPSKHYQNPKRRLYCAFGLVVLACLCAVLVLVVMLVRQQDKDNPQVLLAGTEENSTETTTTTTTTIGETTAAPTAAPVSNVFAESGIHRYSQLAVFLVPWGYYLDDCRGGLDEPVELELRCQTKPDTNEVEIFQIPNHHRGEGDNGVACIKETPTFVSCVAPTTTTGPTPPVHFQMVACASQNDVSGMTLTVEVPPFAALGCGRDPGGLGQQYVGEATSGMSLASLCVPPNDAGARFEWMEHGDGGRCAAGRILELPTSSSSSSSTTSSLVVCATLGTCVDATAPCNLQASDAKLADSVTHPTCFFPTATFLEQWNNNVDLLWDEADKAFAVNGYASQVHLALSSFGTLPP